MKVKPTSIPDIILVQPQTFQDERGFFMETYHARRYEEIGIPAKFIQDNHSYSRQGVLRGMHYQIRKAQGKLVYVVAGEIFDVAVDIRRSSPTLGQWVGTTISARSRDQLWIPPGFAHGFYVISEWAEVIYKVTDFYASEWDRILIWDDPEVGIVWPLVEGKLPTLSDKDAKGKSLSEAELYD